MLGRLQDEVAASMEEQAGTSIRAALGGDGFPAWDPAVPCPEEERQAFRTALAEATGPLKSVSITRREATGISAPVVTTAFNAVGERATAFGVARFSVQPASFPPVLTIRSLEVEVGGRRLALPSVDAAAATPTAKEGATPP